MNQAYRSPGYVRISRASAISIGLLRGWMYKSAVNRCVNLLLQYPEGCYANCAYCGLARHRPFSYEERSFIHVDWPVYSLDTIVDRINQAPKYVKRSCISMITNKHAFEDTCHILGRLKNETKLPVSVLISPTILKQGDLQRLRDLGADKVGVAIDLANQTLFDQFRGRGVKGPHRWERYWSVFEEAVNVFGYKNAGIHLMVGLGETEKELVGIIQHVHDMGGTTHLFSFFAEKGSLLQDRPQPDWSKYLRVQLARYLIEYGLSSLKSMHFDSEGQLTDFGLNKSRLLTVVESGIPFMTTGCEDGGTVSCNRPFGNCLPGTKQWNYPYTPDEEEISLIKGALLGNLR